MTSELPIFNLEFPPYVYEIQVGDYSFKRIPNYKEAFDKMMHLVDSSGSEFQTKVQVGSHQITAVVQLPIKEKKAVLSWQSPLKQLDDILLLFSIFTDRNVFKKDWPDKNGSIVMAEHRMHHYGAQLLLSLKSDWVFKSRKTGEIRTQKQMGQRDEGG